MNRNLCRLCYVNPGLISIFDISAGVQIKTKIEYCCTITQISEDDALPIHICTHCEKDLSSSYCFILRCEELDKKLRSIDVKCVQTESNSKVDIKLKSENCSLVDDAVHDSHNDISSDMKDEDVNFSSGSEKGHNCLKQEFEKRKSRKGGAIYNCSVCGRRWPNPSKLIIHMRSHTNEKPYSCTSCDKKYKDGGSLKRHIKINHLKYERERNFICESCGKGYLTESAIKIHMRIHTGETPYACEFCPARFKHYNVLKRHQIRHTGEKLYPCSTCHKKFFTKDDLKRHYFVHTNTKNFSCSICSASFKQQKNLRNHVRMHSLLNRFKCNYCNHSFAMKKNLVLHIKRLHSSKSGFCNICSKRVADIEMHSGKHTGQRPLKCELCTCSFFKQNALTNHINHRHKFKNKYECTIDGCIADFSSSQKLDYHTLKHHGILPYPCNECFRGFYRKSDLTKHTRGTHKEKLQDNV